MNIKSEEPVQEKEDIDKLLKVESIVGDIKLFKRG